MFSKTLFRLLGVPLTILALALTFAAPATAGGGEGPTGPSVMLTPPTVALDGQGGVVVTTTLICWGNEVVEGAEASVSVNVSLGQHGAGGGAFLETHCAVEPQELTLAVASVTGSPFRPGPVSGLFEFEVITATQGGHGIGEIDQVLKPVQAGR
jgi:hypothetical protein